MAERVVIERYESQLKRYQWVFWYYERRHCLVLDYYEVAERPSTQHKFRAVDCYSRLGLEPTLKLDQFECPEFIKQEAIKEFAKTLTASKEFVR